ICGLITLTLLHRENHRGARLTAIGAVTSVLVGWGVAQWDYMLPESLTVADAAAPSGTIWEVTIATGLAVLVVFPSIALLYRLDQQDLLPEEGAPEPAAGPAHPPEPAT
ncbi:MAG: cytochrome d ubiquinol oxidase subunit II, partial [Ilumatobacteraceae bacterium]